MRLYVCSSGYGNEGVRANRVRGLGSERRDCARELGERGGWVVGITVRILGVVEARTLVLAQWDTVLDAQWQVRLKFKEIRT